MTFGCCAGAMAGDDSKANCRGTRCFPVSVSSGGGAALIKDANKRDAPVISASSAESRDDENVMPYPRCGSGVTIQNIAPPTPSSAVWTKYARYQSTCEMPL